MRIDFKQIGILVLNLNWEIIYFTLLLGIIIIFVDLPFFIYIMISLFLCLILRRLLLLYMSNYLMKLYSNVRFNIKSNIFGSDIEGNIVLYQETDVPIVNYYPIDKDNLDDDFYEYIYSKPIRGADFDSGLFIYYLELKKCPFCKKDEYLYSILISSYPIEQLYQIKSTKNVHGIPILMPISIQNMIVNSYNGKIFQPNYSISYLSDNVYEVQKHPIFFLPANLVDLPYYF